MRMGYLVRLEWYGVFDEKHEAPISLLPFQAPARMAIGQANNLN